MYSLEIRKWLVANAHRIDKRLSSQVHLIYKNRPPNLKLSDLRLCSAVPLLHAPPAYHHAPCHVIQPGGLNIIEHNIHLHEDGQEIIEYVPGQFFADEAAGKSGEQIIIANASHQYLQLTDEVFVLIGTFPELQLLLSGLLYIF